MFSCPGVQVIPERYLSELLEFDQMRILDTLSQDAKNAPASIQGKGNRYSLWECFLKKIVAIIHTARYE